MNENWKKKTLNRMKQFLKNFLLHILVIWYELSRIWVILVADSKFSSFQQLKRRFMRFSTIKVESNVNPTILISNLLKKFPEIFWKLPHHLKFYYKFRRILLKIFIKFTKTFIKISILKCFHNFLKVVVRLL